MGQEPLDSATDWVAEHTRAYVESEFLREDPVFGVRDSLIRSFEADENGELSTTFDVVLDRT